MSSLIQDTRKRIAIKPPTRWASLGFRELWEYRELMFFLAWRDIKVRYKQAVIGVAWAILQPVLMAAIFTLFLGRLAGVPSDDLPYSVFALAGLVPWTFFANAVSMSSQSLVADTNLVSKVYFPRLVIPAASLISWLPDFAIACVILVGVMAVFGIAPSLFLLTFPLFAVLVLIAAGSISIWLSALNVAYRDVRYAVPFLIQLWLFATPVVYPSSMVPDNLRWILSLNPMTGVVEGFRWAILGTGRPPWSLIIPSALVATVFFLTGLFYFRKVERFFADII